MALVTLKAKEVRKLSPSYKVYVTSKVTGEKVVGGLRSVVSKGQVKKVIETKKYSVILSMSDLDKDFIFERKRRIKKFDYTKKLTIDKFL